VVARTLLYVNQSFSRVSDAGRMSEHLHELTSDIHDERTFKTQFLLEKDKQVTVTLQTILARQGSRTRLLGSLNRFVQQSLRFELDIVLVK